MALSALSSLTECNLFLPFISAFLVLFFCLFANSWHDACLSMHYYCAMTSFHASCDVTVLLLITIRIVHIRAAGLILVLNLNPKSSWHVYCLFFLPRFKIARIWLLLCRIYPPSKFRSSLGLYFPSFHPFVLYFFFRKMRSFCEFSSFHSVNRVAL